VSKRVSNPPPPVAVKPAYPAQEKPEQILVPKAEWDAIRAYGEAQKAEVERLRGLAIAGADLSIATASEGKRVAEALEKAEAERDALAATLSEIQQASQDYSDGKITRYEFVKKLAFLAAVQPQQNIAKIRAEAVLNALSDAGVTCPKFADKSKDFVDGFNFLGEVLTQHAEKILQGGDV